MVMQTWLRRFVHTMSVIVVLIAGCAFDITDVRYAPATLQSLAQPERTFVLTGDVLVSQAPCGYARILRQHTRFSTSVGFFVGHVYGELVDPEVGLSEIQECKYSGGEPPAP